MRELLVVIGRVGVGEELRNGEVPGHHIDAVGLVLIGGGAEQQAQVEVTDLVVHVGQEGIVQILVTGRVVGHHTALPDLFDGGVGRDAVGVDLRVGVKTDAVGDVPPFGDVGTDIHVAGETVGVVVHLEVVDDPVRVLLVIPGILTVSELTVAGTVFVEVVRHLVGRSPCKHGMQGAGTAGTVECITGQGAVGVGLRVCHVGAEGEDTDLLFAVETDGVFLISGLGDDTALVEIGTGEEEVAVLRTARHVDALVEGDAGLEEFVDVVVEDLALLTPGVVAVVVLDGLLVDALLVLVFKITLLVLVLESGKSLSPGSREFGVHIDFHGTFLTFLGSDQDHAVRGTGTVQCGSGRALQHGHALDILGVDIHHTVRGSRSGAVGSVEAGVTDRSGGVIVDDTVHDKQRLVVFAFGSGGTATQDDLGAGTGSTGRLGDVDACDLAREGGDRVGGLVLHQFGSAEVLDGITQGFLLLLDTEGRHDGLLQHLGIVGQDDVDDRTSGNGYRLGLIADAGEGQGTIRRCVDLVRTVDIG